MSTSLIAQSYSGGDGETAETAFQIANKADLKYLSENSDEWTKHFIQTADINFIASDFENGGDFYNSGNGFIPIGTLSPDFSGSYNGDGYTIDGLFINRSGTERIGFFGRTGSAATISNIGLTNVDITGAGVTGGLIGQSYSDVSNCYTTGSVSGSYSVGGLIGQTESNVTVTDCYSTSAVSGTEWIGGLVGSLGYSISRCYSAGDVSGSSSVGGLVGIVFDFPPPLVSNCYSKGDVTRISGDDPSFGAFLGKAEFFMGGNITIEKCYSIGSVDCGSATDKGFVGTESGGSGTYNDNFFDYEVSNQSNATGATDKTTTQMKTQSTFTNWNFTTVWEIVGGDGANYPRLIDNPDPTLPVTLSNFTAQYIESIPILCWTTQSESNNAGWNIYRGETNEALSNEEAYLLNLSLGLIPGAGSTSEPTEYSFEDVFPVYAGTTYFYWLESVDYSGECEIYGPISLSIPENEWQNPYSPEIPKPYGLNQNYPNPFNPNTEISFMLKESCIGELSIYNVKGQKIKTLFTNLSIPRDELLIYNWNGKDESGKEVSTGVYYYKLRTTKGNFVRKMILLK